MPKSSDQPTRASIIAAAIEEIGERGWLGVRTRGIADRAGVNPALIHYHFGSMEQVLMAAVSEVLHAVVEEFRLPQEPSLAEQMHRLAEQLDEVGVEDSVTRVLLEAMIHAPRSEELMEETRRLLDGYRSELSHSIEKAASAGELGDGADAEGLAIAFVALFDGLALHSFIDSDLDVGRSVRALTELWKERK